MDEASRAKLRQRAKRAFEWTMVAYGLAILGAISAIFLRFPILENELPKLEIVKDSHCLWQERMRYTVERARRLGYFAPPAAEVDRAHWARQIQDFYGYPVPVCVIEGTHANWVVTPDVATQALADSALAAPNPSRPRAPLLHCGSIVVRHAEAPHPFPGEGSFVVASDSSRRLAWGALVDYDQEWLAFYRHLSLPKDSTVEYVSPVLMLTDIYSLPRNGGNAGLPRIRARYKDEVIFASPDLDTTAVMYRLAPWGGLQEELYAPPHSLARFSLWLIRTLLWIFPVFALIVMLTIYGWYRRVMKLSAPEPPSSVSRRETVQS